MNLFKLRDYLKNYKALIGFGVFFKFLEAVTDIITPFLVAKMIDIGVADGNAKYIWTVGIIVFAMNLLGVIFAVICQKCSAVASKGMGRDIRHNMFCHINTFSHAELDRFTTMSLTNRSVHDVAQVQNAVGMTIRNIARAPFLLVGSIIMAMIIDLRLSLVFIVLSPILAFVIYFVMKKTSPLYTRAKTELDNVSNVTRENLSGIRVVRAFNKQETEKKRFEKVNSKLAKTTISVGNIGACFQPLVYVLVNFGIVAIVWFGGIRVNVGGLKTGDIVAFINYFSQISMSLLTIARVLLVYTKTGSSMKRIGEVFEIKNSVVESENATEINPENPATIEFKNVSFSYNTTKEIIKNLSFTLSSGQTLGIIGGTGAGKSSIVNLIPRFYDVDKGSVLINGIDVKKYNLKSLREYIGIVPQNPTLFEGTLEENLKWRKADATSEELVKALKIAQAYDFVVEYPDFLKHKVERGGTNFSGGQKQRLTIARALVGNPKILILDDSSSALDFATDSKLRKSIYRGMKDITTIIVSQRINTIKNSDLIIVVNAGNIVGLGSHYDLMENCSEYAEIYHSQNKEEGE